MSQEQTALSACVRAATTMTPRITNAVVKAAHGSKPLAERRHQLDEAIRVTGELLDALRDQRTLLRWRSQDGDAA